MQIESYDFGKIVIDGAVYTSDILLYPDKVDSSWWREEGHNLSSRDIEAVFASEPEVVIIGTGFYGVMSVPQEVQNYIISKGIRLEVHPTKDACNKYNEIAKSARTVGAFHLTC